MGDVTYYEMRSDGHYCVHFANKRGLSVDEIKEFFTQFGEVMYVNCAGDEHGFRFVTMRSEEDVKRCIVALRNHEFIRILPKRNKSQDSNGKSKQEGNNVKQPRRNSKMDRSNNQNHKKNEDLNASINDSFSDTGSLKRRPSETNSNHSMLSEFARIRKNRETSDNPPNNQAENLSNQDDKEQMPELITVERFVPPNLQASINGKTVPPPTIPAHEVVVANIHRNLGIHYILHLFEKYNPICVTTMKTILPFNIRYCHIYFKTPQEALATEKEFDRTVLCGMDLIVLRPQKLEEGWNS